jgi:hypothetical protein
MNTIDELIMALELAIDDLEGAAEAHDCPACKRKAEEAREALAKARGGA